MHVLNFAFLLLNTVYVVRCAPVSRSANTIDAHDLRGILNWIRGFSRDYGYNKERYEEFTEEVMNNIGLPNHDTFEEALSETITKVKGIRTALVVGVEKFINFSDNTEQHMKHFSKFIVAISNIFDDLKVHIAKWEKDSKGKLSEIKTTDPIQFQWFKEHGFDESKLNSITIEELKQAIYDSYDISKPLDRLLEVYGTQFVLQPTVDSRAFVVWLTEFFSSNAVIPMVERYLKSDDCKIEASVALEISTTLLQLKESRSILGLFSENCGNSSTNKKYTKLIEKAIFMESHAPQYIKTLKDICEYVELDMSLVSCYLGIANASTILLILEGYCLVGMDGIDPKEVEDRAKAFIDENGPMRILCNAASKLNNVSSH